MIFFLLECDLCKIQYVWKSEVPFHIPFNKQESAIETDKYFTLPSYNFNTKTKFILFEQLINRKNYQ